jgi:hypothetical protein
VLWVIAFLVLEGAANPPDGGSATEVLAYYEDDTGAILTGTYLFGLGVLFFLWFLGSLRSVLHRTEGGVGRLSAVAFGSGVATSVLLLGFAAPSIAAAITADENELSAESAQALWTLEDGFFVASWFTIAVLFAATAVVSLRAGALPRWLAWVSLVLAVAIVVPWVGWAVLIFGFPLWVLVVSVLLWRQSARGVEASATVP